MDILKKWVSVLGMIVTVLFADPASLIRMAESFKTEAQAAKTEAITFARRENLPVRQEYKDGTVIEIQRIVHAVPLYYTTANENAAITTRTNYLWTNPFNVDGTGYDHLGTWDGGAVRGTHDELHDRVTQVDGASTLSDHATHVAGTLIASGVDSSAKGMASKATLLAYDWNSDESEMANAASNGMELSNHSYGYITGWYGSGAWY